MSEDAVVTLSVLDKTSGGLQSAANKLRQNQTMMRQLMRGTSRDYDELGRSSERAGRRTEEAHRRAARAVKYQRDEMTSMLATYARSALSLEAARRAVLGFANTDEHLRRMRNQAGATADEMKRVGEAARILSRQTGQSIDDLIVGFDKFRDFAGLSVDEGLKIFPAVAKGAQALGVSVDDMSASVSAMMVNANLQGKDVVKVIDQMTKAGQDYRLEFNQLVKAAPRLTEVMGEWGYTGVRGNAAALAWLASLRKVSSGTDEAAEALAKVMELMTNPSTAEKLGYTSDSMAAGLKKAQAAGKDTLSVFLDVVAQAQARGIELSEIFSKREIRFVRQLMRDRRDIKDWSADIQNSTGTADKSFRVWAEGSKKSILDVTNEIKNLMDTFGELLIRFGAVQSLEKANKSLRSLMELIDLIGESIENQSIDWEKFVGLTGLRNSLDAFLATWRTYIEQIKTYASGNITSPSLLKAQIAQAEAQFKVDSKLPRITLGDVRTSIGGGEQLPKSALGMLWDQLSTKRALTDEEKRAKEQLEKLNESGDALNQTLKKMRFELEDTGPGGAKVWKASYGGGPGGVGGARGYGGGPGGFGPGGGTGGWAGFPYAGGGRFGGAGLGALGRGMGGGMPPLPGDAPMMPKGGIGGGPGGGAGAMDKQQLRNQLEKEITNSPLNGFVPPDGERYGIKTGSPKEWSHFMTELAGKESGYRPGAVGDVGGFGGHGSRGLFQLSPQDAQTYGLNEGKPFSYGQLHDPTTNMRAAVDILSQRVRQGGIGGRGGAAAYWGPLQRGWTPGQDIAGGGGGTGQQGYNYFQKRGARPLQSSQLTPVDTPYGRVMAHPQAADDVRGFFGELSEQGAPLKRPGSYNYRQKRWGGGWSSHAYGTAFDLDDQVQISPEMRRWIAANPQRWDEIKSKYNMGQPLPEKDPAHVEWRGPPPISDTARRDQQTIQPTPSQDTWGRDAKPAPYMSDRGGAIGQFSRQGDRDTSYDEDTPAPSRTRGGDDDFEGARRARQELERPIRANLDLGGSTQFGRASMRREADREVREARFNSTMDIGAA